MTSCVHYVLLYCHLLDTLSQMERSYAGRSAMLIHVCVCAIQTVFKENRIGLSPGMEVII